MTAGKVEEAMTLPTSPTADHFAPVTLAMVAASAQRVEEKARTRR